MFFLTIFMNIFQFDHSNFCTFNNVNFHRNTRDQYTWFMYEIFVNKFKNYFTLESFHDTSSSISRERGENRQSSNTGQVSRPALLICSHYILSALLVYLTGLFAVFTGARKLHLTPGGCKMSLVLWMMSRHSSVMNEVVNSYATIKNNAVLTFIFLITIKIISYDIQEKQSYTGFR